MCALRAHVKLSNFRNILSGIEKAVNTFSIFEKIFPNIGYLMCALRAHISKILINYAVLYYIQIYLKTAINEVSTLQKLALCRLASD